MQSLGSFVLPIEVAYDRENVGFRGTDLIHGVQQVRFEVSEIDLSAFAPERGALVLLIGSTALRGAPRDILCQLLIEQHLPHQYTLNFMPLASRICRDGYTEVPLGSLNAVTQVAPVYSVPGDPGDADIGVKIDAIEEALLTAVAAAKATETGVPPTPLWSMEQVAAACQSSNLSQEGIAECTRIVFEEQPSRAFPTREGPEACRFGLLDLPRMLDAAPPFRGGISCPIRAADYPIVEGMMEMGIASHQVGKTPADFEDADFLIGHAIYEAQPNGPPKPRFVINSRPVNDKMAALGLTRRIHMEGVVEILQKLAGAVWLSTSDLVKAYFQGRVAEDSKHHFMLLGPNGQVIRMEAWTMGFYESGGLLADNTQTAANEFNGWSCPVPSGFEPPGGTLTRRAVWFADNSLMAMFVKQPDGSVLFLDDADPRRKLLEPAYLDCLRAYLRMFREWRMSWSLPKSEFCRLEIDTMGHYTNRKEIGLSKSAFQALEAVVPPELGMTEARTSKQLQSVLGMLGYVAQACPSEEALVEYNRLRAIARAPTSRDESRVSASNYGPAQREAIVQMRDLLLRWQYTRRRLLDPTKPGLIVSDACNTGWSVSIYQLGENGRFGLVACVAGTFGPDMAVAKTMRLEAGGLIQGARRLDSIIQQLPVAVWRTDAETLRTWSTSTDPALRRWWLELTQYLNFRIVVKGMQHLTGKCNPADWPSRLLCMPADAAGAPVRSISQLLIAADTQDVAPPALVAAIVANAGEGLDKESESHYPIALPASSQWRPLSNFAPSDEFGPLQQDAAREEFALAAALTRSMSMAAAAEEEERVGTGEVQGTEPVSAAAAAETPSDAPAIELQRSPSFARCSLLSSAFRGSQRASQRSIVDFQKQNCTHCVQTTAFTRVSLMVTR